MEDLKVRVEQYLVLDSSGEYFVKFAGHILYSVYQEIFTYDHGQIEPYGCEALFRIKNNKEGLTPLDFLLSLPSKDHNIFDRALRAAHIRNYVASELNHLKIFINVDATSYSNHENMVDGFNLLIYRLTQLNIKPHQVVFEFIETPCLQYEFLAQSIKNLRNAGIGIAVDDYGVKYSSLERVKKIKPDIVKFDRSWLVNARDDMKQRESYLRNIEIIRNLGIKVLIEGVELEQDLEIVKVVEPDFVQGFYYGYPKAIVNNREIAV